MKSQLTNKVRLWVTIYCLICMVSIFIAITHIESLQVGKDGGSISIILLTCLSSLVLFFFIEKNWWRFILGFLVAFVGFFLMYFLIFILSTILEPYNGVELPEFLYILIPFLVIYVVALYRICNLHLIDGSSRPRL